MIYFCAQRNRRTAVLAKPPPLNGIDYLEVADETGQKLLLLTLLRDATPLQLRVPQVEILGGESVTGIQVLTVTTMPDVPSTLEIRVDRAGDFSTYTLVLRADANSEPPPPGIDPALSRVEFSFKAGCPASGDCQPISCCPTPVPAEPDINYVTKDYPGFVQVMLDRMAVLAPGWTERHAADLGVALVEVLAYVADHLSYRQDAVATEAYLGTARSRISLRRHARLVDYRVDEGENARAWIQFQTNDEGVVLPKGTQILPRIAGVAPQLDPDGALAQQILQNASVVFTTLTCATLSKSLNQISFHTWSDEACCLPAGSTAATLKGYFDNQTLPVGSVLLFEEILGPQTNQPEDADRTHCCAVRLTRVHSTVTDPVTKEEVTDIEWDAADALPFTFCISSQIGEGPAAQVIDNVSVALGNVVPADQGAWTAPKDPVEQWEVLGTVPEPPLAPVSPPGGDCCNMTASVPAPLPVFFPALKAAPLTFARDFDETNPGPASALGGPAAPNAGPPKARIEVVDDHNNEWTPEPDLLSLTEFKLGFVVEIERDGTAYLRFGDGQYGAAPDTGESFRARYRVGNGTAGNVGANTLGHVLTKESRISRVRNPLPASGGRDPDTMETIRQLAPFSFRTQLRAVTEADYGEVATRDPEIRAARGTLRWTGSWHTAFVTLDPAPQAPPPALLAATTAARLDLLRMAGVDLAVEPAAIVGLRVALSICVKPYYSRSEVERALRRVFTAGPTCDGTLGLLDPSNFSFGQTIYLSPFIAAAQRVEGVAVVRATAFQRVDDPKNDTTAAGYITMQRLEIARIDNDPSRPDRGFLELSLDGGA